MRTVVLGALNVNRSSTGLSVGRYVDGPIAVRHEGPVTIISVVEEVPVVVTRHFLKEEVRVTKRRVETVVPTQVPVLEQTATIERPVLAREEELGHRAVADHAEELEGSLVRRLEGELERGGEGYLDCGLRCRGFARLRCGACGDCSLVAFSCKGRGFCPSCMSRRMCATAANLVEHVLPEVGLRQWVLTFPFPARRRPRAGTWIRGRGRERWARTSRPRRPASPRTCPETWRGSCNPRCRRARRCSTRGCRSRRAHGIRPRRAPR